MIAHFRLPMKHALESLPRQKPSGGEISVHVILSRKFLSFKPFSVIVMFNVPGCGT